MHKINLWQNTELCHRTLDPVLTQVQNEEMEGNGDIQQRENEGKTPDMNEGMKQGGETRWRTGKLAVQNS